MIFSKLLKAIKRKQSKGMGELLCVDTLGFCNTVEGCTLWNYDHDTYRAVSAVFKRLPYDVKRALTFAPKNGEFCERVHLWRFVLKSSLPSAQYHTAMSGIYSSYKRIKRIIAGANNDESIYA